MSKEPSVYTRLVGHDLACQVPLVMLHGHGGDHCGLVTLAKSMNRRVYLLDLPGFGRSADMESFTVDSYSASLMKHIQTLFNGGKYDLLGHSMGSAIALSIAADDAQVRSLTMVNAIPRFEPAMKLLTRGAEELAVHLPESMALRAIHSNFYNFVTYMLHSQNRYALPALKAYMVTQKQVNYSLPAWREAGRAVYEMNQALYARRAMMPVLMVGGSRDKMSSTESLNGLSSKFSSSHLEIIDGAGHFIPQENYSQASIIISKFLLGLNK